MRICTEVGTGGSAGAAATAVDFAGILCRRLIEKRIGTGPKAAERS